jgi:hypothetical protein
MKPLGDDWWAKARKARDQLEKKLLGNPEVSMIDIGLSTRSAESAPVLRVHVRKRNACIANLPQEVDGIPVCVIYGNYELQSDMPA